MARRVIEVLSPSTQHFDRGAKLLAYQKLQGLRQIVLLSSTEEAAWTCARYDDGAWSPLEAWDRGTGLEVPSLGLALTWDKVFGGVGLGHRAIAGCATAKNLVGVRGFEPPASTSRT